VASEKSRATEARFAAFMRQAGPVRGAVDNAVIGPSGGGVNTAVAHYTVPAADAALLSGGEAFEAFAHGGFSTGGTAPTLMMFTLYWNGVGGSSLCSLTVPAAGLWANAASAGWSVKCHVTFVSATEAETTIELNWRTATGVAASVTWTSTQNQAGLTTSGDRDLTLAFQFTPGAAGHSLTVKGARIWREA